MDITKSLSNEEITIAVRGGEHVRVKNLGDNTVYVSKYPDIIIDNDNVIEIPSGCIDGIPNVCQYQIIDGTADYYGTIYAKSDGETKIEVRTQNNANFRQIVKGGDEITVDNELSESSENPVQNRVITAQMKNLNFVYDLSIALAEQIGYNGYAGTWFVVSTNPEASQYRSQTFEKLILLSSVTSIGNSAFMDCTSLENINISNSVTSIGGNAFNNCTSLENINISNSVTMINSGTFYNCKSLASITIDSVTSIGDYAFGNCTSLKDVYFGGTQEQWSAITINSGNDNLLNANIHYNR